jgi:hypothetical protein
MIFIFLYIRNIDGHIGEALASPFTLVIIVFPFLPAAVLSLLSMKAENKFFKLLQDDSGGKAKEASKPAAPAKTDAKAAESKPVDAKGTESVKKA